MAGNRRRAQQDVIPFDVARVDALSFILRKEDKPGCAEKDVDPIIGKGLYAEKAYLQGEFIVEYAGDLISRKEGIRRENTYPASKGSYIYFFVWDSKKYCLDATESSRRGRFANDAGPDDVHQNATMKCVSSKGKPHLALFAKRKIKIGEEIRYDYGVPDLPWRKQGHNRQERQDETARIIKDLQKKECRVLLKKLPLDTLQEVIVEEPLQEVIVQEPLQEVIVQEPLQEVIVQEPLQEVIVQEPLQEVIVQEPLQEVIVQEPLQEVIVQEPLQGVIVKESLQEKIVQDSVPEDIGQNSVQEEIWHDSVPEEIGQDSVPEDIGQNSVPKEIGQNPVPEDIEQDSVQKKIEQNSVPEEIGQGSVPEEIGQNSVPEEIGQDLVTEEIGHDSVPEEIGQYSVPEDIGQDSVQEEIGQNSMPEEIGQDSVPGEIGQDLVPEEIGHNSMPEEIGQDSVSQDIGQDSMPEIEQDLVPEEIGQDSVQEGIGHEINLSSNFTTSNPYSQNSGENGTTEGKQDTDCPNSAGNKDKSKTSRPRRPCPFCGTMASRLTDHIKRRHKFEESVKAALALPKDLRDKEFEKMKKEGIFKANTDVLMKENPDYSKLMNQRRQENDSLAMCSLCKGFYHKKIINRHKKRCSSAEGTTDYPTTFSIKLLGTQPIFSDSYIQEILNCFHDNEVGALIRSDDWIKRYGYLCFQNFEGTEKRTEKRSSLMSNLRRLAHLFMEFKQIVSKDNPCIKLNSCSQMFDRDFILYIQDAICSMTTDKETKAVKNGLKVSLRYLISDVCKVMRANYLLLKQDEKAEEMAKFISVLQLIWPSFFASAEESVVKKRQSDLRRPVRLPSEKEIEQLRDCTKDIIERLSADMFETLDYTKFSQLRDAVVCRLTLFNARRGGEPSRMTIKDWEDALQDVWIDQEKVEHVEDDIEKKLLCENKIAYIHASKVSKLVPLLIPKDCWQPMKILTDCEVRRAAQINEKNKYAFPNMKHSKNHASGWYAVSNLCKKAGLEHNISATDMRHYVATSYALLDVSPSDREMFYKHLGHSKQMNENVYQCPPAMRTITKVGKFLNQLEGNIDTSLSNSKKSSAKEVQVETLSEFIELMAADMSLSDILNFYTKIDEEHVTINPEELRNRSSLVLDKNVQSHAKKFFTEDAWLCVMNTLTVLAANDEYKMQGKNRENTSGLKRTRKDDDISENEIPGPSVIKRSRNVVSYICEDSSSSDEPSDKDDKVSTDEDTIAKGKKHIWSSNEDAAVKRFFRTYIDDVSESGNKGKLHVTSDICSFIQKYPEILNDFPRQKKIHLIRTKIMNLRRQSRERPNK
ncbi:uncharacterized protein LOC133201942 [Saccostrea echinata]|uniref:uncharacterized protein LOC133201942 n=1 Tax=Saccostrea echinata TaxID=191078 RepID=UPI002A8393BF|nr:uncharacterized protein LOC133201942 [Saccostrea echinata]